MRRINCLVVDDSSFMRRAITAMIEEDPHLKVIDVARDGLEAIKKVETLKPDVVTLDIEMPRMNGLEALKVIMERHPVPVLMVSSLTEEGAKATFDALELGALDYIPKHLDKLSVNVVRIKKELVAKIKAVAGKKVGKRELSVKSRQLTHHPSLITHNFQDRFVSQRIAVVAIGASTGGPLAVEGVLRLMPSNFPAAILVVQHMPRGFTSAYAERLNRLCNLEVKEASNGDTIVAGKVFIAPGGVQTRFKREGTIEFRLTVEDDPPDAIYKPSVDIALLSLAECFPGRALGVILTGMGSDGREGIRAIKKTGGRAIAQDEASCVVYGMPKAVIDEGLVDKVVPLDMIPGEIVNMV